MSARNGVVAHFLDGSVLKGTTQDFSPNRPTFHLFRVEPAPGVLVRCQELKAVFFVRDLSGDATREDPVGFLAAPAENAHGRKIAVRFADNELLCGYSLSYSAKREGFFMFPADTASNNLRIYVVAANAAEVREGSEAETLAQKAIKSRAA